MKAFNQSALAVSSLYRSSTKLKIRDKKCAIIITIVEVFAIVMESKYGQKMGESVNINNNDHTAELSDNNNRGGSDNNIIGNDGSAINGPGDGDVDNSTKYYQGRSSSNNRGGDVNDQGIIYEGNDGNNNNIINSSINNNHDSGFQVDNMHLMEQNLMFKKIEELSAKVAELQERLEKKATTASNTTINTNKTEVNATMHVPAQSKRFALLESDSKPLPSSLKDHDKGMLVNRTPSHMDVSESNKISNSNANQNATGKRKRKISDYDDDNGGDSSQDAGSNDIEEENEDIGTTVTAAMNDQNRNSRRDNLHSNRYPRAIIQRSAASPNIAHYTWANELHRLFIASIFDIGLAHASPKNVLDMMYRNGATMVTPEHIKSHLQKYRNNSKATRQEFLEHFQSVAGSISMQMTRKPRVQLPIAQNMQLAAMDSRTKIGNNNVRQVKHAYQMASPGYYDSNDIGIAATNAAASHAIGSMEKQRMLLTQVRTLENIERGKIIMNDGYLTSSPPLQTNPPFVALSSKNLVPNVPNAKKRRFPQQQQQSKNGAKGTGYDDQSSGEIESGQNQKEIFWFLEE